MAEIDVERLLRDFRELRAIGTYRTGVHRPSLRPDHVRSLHWLSGKLTEAGLTPEIDGIGNLLGRSPAPGRKLLAGSHLESQNYAGWLDGPLGVLYALEAARAVAADPSVAGSGVEVVAFCDEEGHFGHFLGSRSLAGQVSEAMIDEALCRTDGTPMREALAAAGFAGRPRIVLDPKRYIGFLEAHIEQGDWLEANRLKIGVVTSIVAIWQFRITIEGYQNHAGTTRMAIRKDAGVAAVRLLSAIEERFPQVCGPRTVWTTGRITLDPGAPSIIPGKAEVLFQIRDDDREVLDRLERTLGELVAAADRSGPCRLQVEAIRKSWPAVMAEPLQKAIEAAAEHHCPGLHTRMPSGAGHDAQVMAEILPASMMFVPSIGGISHHWTEDTAEEDIVLGARVYAEAAARMLRGDA
jgi:N-carbamoyl-L-amino-acid hydrolase